jgi:hypothetical protein
MIDSQMKRQDLGRAKNALQDYLIRKLLIPKVYLDANWNGKSVDVLAIDRAGVGDVHAVYIVYQGHDVENALETVIANAGIHLMPHFLYAAVVYDGTDKPRFALPERIIQKSLAEDGVGRVGILYVDLSEDDPRLQVVPRLKAERFRSSKEIVEQTDQLVAEHAANWEYRE